MAARLPAAGKQPAVVKHLQSPPAAEAKAGRSAKGGASTAKRAGGKALDLSARPHGARPPPRFDGAALQFQQQQAAGSTADAAAADAGEGASRLGSMQPGAEQPGRRTSTGPAASRKRVTPLPISGELMHHCYRDLPLCLILPLTYMQASRPVPSSSVLPSVGTTSPVEIRSEPAAKRAWETILPQSCPEVLTDINAATIEPSVGTMSIAEMAAAAGQAAAAL